MPWFTTKHGRNRAGREHPDMTQRGSSRAAAARGEIGAAAGPASGDAPSVASSRAQSARARRTSAPERSIWRR